MTEVNYNTPMTGWVLVKTGDTGEIQEDDTGVINVRKHTTIQIKRQVKLGNVPTARELHTTRMAITYVTGDQTKTENPPGAGKFICTFDGIDTIKEQADYVYRVQVWEYFGPWEAPPDGWNV